MKFTSTLVTLIAVLRSADAKKDKEEDVDVDVEMVDVDTKFVVDYPTYFPTYAPTVKDETSSPKGFLGNDLIDVPELGIRLDSSLTATKIANVGQKVQLTNGESSLRWHNWMDGATAIALPNGNHVYVSNSEDDDGKGGVYGLYFDKDGKPYDYKQLLSGTTWNCSGGQTPWDTWVSCEEHSRGQCWEIDPNPSSDYHHKPQQTVLGGQDGGMYEAVAVQDDIKKADGPTFFVTEDQSNGALRRVETSCRGWEALKVGGCSSKTTYLRFLNNQRFEWTSDENLGRQSASKHYPNTEGITYHNGKLSFVSKAWYVMFTLDFDSMTWTKERTGRKLIGQGSFLGQPDGVISGYNQRYMYFTEEDEKGNGMYARDEYGQYYTVFQAMSGQYVGDETVGMAVSPDGKTMYVGYQESGVLFALKRKDDKVWDR
ncbi:hypothetical protein ACHAWT_003608 [Skeletonema menzelii]